MVRREFDVEAQGNKRGNGTEAIDTELKQNFIKTMTKMVDLDRYCLMDTLLETDWCNYWQTE